MIDYGPSSFQLWFHNYFFMKIAGCMSDTLILMFLFFKKVELASGQKLMCSMFLEKKWQKYCHLCSLEGYG
jgi:hypothetical protein